MRPTVHRAWAGLALAALALTPAVPAAAAPADDEPSLPGIYVRVPPEPPDQAARAARDGDFRLIYLHRSGGTYYYGQNNSSTNRSSIIRGSSATVSPTTLTDDKWDEMLRCVQIQFGRFGVYVTDVDPGATPHVEAVVTGGSSTEIGLEGAGGVAPFSCGVIERAIVFIFQAGVGQSPQRICEVVAQEVGHAYGLDHALLCEDPMTYLRGCGEKWFKDEYAHCGEDTARTCACQTGGLQNSVAHMLQVLGPAETIPPQVSIVSPAAGASVKPGFAIDADATDNYVVIKAELWLDGKLESTIERPPFRFTTRKTIAPGARVFEVRAYDPAGNLGSAEVAVTLEPECQADGDCAAGQTCAGHLCVGEMGATCRHHSDCGDGLSCGLHDGEQRCTRSCGGGGGCPSGFECTAGANGVCWPADGGGGWCAVSAPAGAPGRALGGVLILLLGAALVGAVARPTRRRSRR